MTNFRDKANLIWNIADLLRGDYKQADYGKIILPLVVLRRLDCVLEGTKPKVLQRYEKVKDKSPNAIDNVLNAVAGYSFHNHSKYNFEKLLDEPNKIAPNLRNYINGFSQNARDIIEHFGFGEHINKLDRANLLFLVVKKVSEIDLHPDKVKTIEMGYIFEELIRKFAEASNETAGEHFTPREVIRLMVDLLFANDREILTKKGIVKTLYDPACGTGGMLSVAEEYLRELNPHARLELFGQELNPETYSVCKSDMLIKGQNPDHIKLGNSFSEDGFPKDKFDYSLSNPPFGVEWKKVQEFIKKEADELGFAGRFGAGLPRITDGSLLFLQHMMSKMQPKNGGARLAIVLNGSPLFAGGAGSGESEIRKWVIENDLLETVVALPDQLFYNTAINTYVWILTNRKPPARKGKVQLIDATSFWEKMQKSFGNKRKQITNSQIEDIVGMYGALENNRHSKVLRNEEFGYYQITIEQPLRDSSGKIVKDSKGNVKPDPELRQYENVPLTGDIREYFKKEVLPHIPEAWIDEKKIKVGYEIAFPKYFYEYRKLRSLNEIKEDILDLEKTSGGNLAKLTS